MAKSLTKLLFRPKIIISEGFLTLLNITFSHFFFFLHAAHGLSLHGKLWSKPNNQSWYPKSCQRKGKKAVIFSLFFTLFLALVPLFLRYHFGKIKNFEQ